MNNLCEEFVIIIDDYNRTGEQNMALKLFKLLESRGITYYKKIYEGLKYHLVLCSENYKFITWL